MEKKPWYRSSECLEKMREGAEKGRENRKKIPLEDRLSKKVLKGVVFLSKMHDDCWIWFGPRIKYGYGRRNGKLIHRLFWTIYNGVIPDKLFVCHHCDNPSCVNPSHLFLGTNQDNVNDKMKKGRYKSTKILGWSRNYNSCIVCHTSSKPHFSKGMCGRCYQAAKKYTH